MDQTGMFSIKSLFISFLFFCCTATWAAPPELKVNGINIQTVSDGCNVRLVGVNICGAEWSASSYGPPSGAGGDMVQSVNSAISTWKSNCVRIPLNQDFWFGYSDGSSKSSTTLNQSYQTKYRKFIDDAIAAASAKNAYVELDLHWSGSGSWGSSITAKQQNMPDDHSTDFWQDVATRYKNNPAVIFNLYNEPKDDSWTIWKSGGQSKSNFHTPGFQSLVNTVRTTGAKNIIVVGGLGWAYDMTGIAANALTDPSGNGIAYEAHIYDNKVPNGTMAAKITDCNTKVTVAVKAGYCVIIGEFGPTTDGKQDNSGCTPYEAELIKWIDGTNTANYVYSAMGWSFNTDATPRLISNWSFGATTCHGAQVQTWLASVKTPTCTEVLPTPRNTTPNILSVANNANIEMFDIFGRVINKTGTKNIATIKNGIYLYRGGALTQKSVIVK